MNPAEAQVLLSMAAAYDNRKPDPDAAKAWAAALDGLRFDDCRVALIEHYRTSTEWLMPAMVRKAVQRIRASRIEDHPPITPPSGLTPIETNRWLATARRRIGDGEVLDTDATYGELKPRHLPDLKQLMPNTTAERGESETSDA